MSETGGATAGLPDEVERALYFDLLAQGGRVMFRDVAPADAGAVLRLLELGLLVHNNLPDSSLTAVNPRSVGERLSAELRSEGTRLLTRAEEMPTLLGDLTRAYDGAPRRVDRLGEVQYVDNREEIRHRIIQIEADYREEALAAQPGPRPAQHLDAAVDRTRLALERGCAMHILYELETKSDATAVAYAATVTGWGARFRVLREPFTRMMIFDRRVAVIPASADHGSAAFVEDPAVVNFLVDVFQRDWERAERVHWGSDDGSPVHEQVGRLLTQGLTQRTIASRLGLSERTVAGHISRLRELHDAETLFQLGWQMRGAGAFGQPVATSGDQ
ncbi:LuxR C-terminal-related transcriptional regulator [Kitasatospora sp. McL0602]|uniref:LuxR C-terminal-related transcriptional regulator n=1 Tax=Kitasatospora sp. McL0602 TaxID=3439530 RepID=UPI003F8BC30A